MNTYYQCPRKYFYQYNLKLPRSKSIHLIRGSIAHNALENFFTINPDAISGSHNECLRMIILDMLKEEWKNSKSKLDELNMGEHELNMFYSETQDMLVNWTGQFMNKIDSLMSNGLSFSESFKKLTPQTEIRYMDDELMVQGYIDAIEDVDGKIRLMDYKTSKNAHISDEYRNQLAIYALLYEKRHGKRPDSVGIYFLKDTEHVLDVDDELINHAKFIIEQMHLLTDKMDDISDYPKKESGLCKWSSGQCDFYEYCFEGKEVPGNGSGN